MMSSTHYLPSEVLQYSNYPEVHDLKDKIALFQSNAVPVMSALSDYDTGIEPYIYVNIAEVIKLRDLAFELSDILGAAPKVCYDVLLPIRDAQEALNELIFSFQYEKVPVVVDRQRNAMQELNAVVNKSGEVI
jgi:hypothetical protein